MRENLQQKKVPQKLPATHISSYNLKWKPGGVDPGDSHHAAYLDALMSEFESKVIRLVKNAKAHQTLKILDNEYYTGLDEILHHLHFCKEKCANFRGQNDILKQICVYLQNSKNRKPLVIHGKSGHGKTSLLAMAFNSVCQWFGKKNFRMIRFLGTSPDSTHIYDVLYSIIGQLADITDTILDPMSYANMKSMVKYFPRFLRNVSRAVKHPVYIFLDSIDQLKSSDGAYSMKWLPNELPPNINIVLSTLPDASDILQNARKHIASDSCFIEVPPLQDETSAEIIDAVLKSKNRCLTSVQRQVIMTSLAKVPSPLYLKLLLDRAVKWRSYDSTDDLPMADSVQGAINHLFTSLEDKYGSTLISYTFGYLTVGMNGLSEVELENALSCNDEVLNAVYQYHDPPVEGTVSIPSLLWARVRHDISEYVVERLSNGKKTIYWYHRQFIEAAYGRYANDSKAKELHRDLAVIYQAEKGIKRDILLIKRKKSIPEADRQVMPQPLTTKNTRKLLALPHHLKGSGNVDHLKQAALCNLRFMMTKFRGLSMSALLKDYLEAMEVFESDREICIIHACLEQIKGVKQAELLPNELLCRISPDPGVPNVTGLLEQAKEYLEVSDKASLLPLYPCLVKDDLSEMFHGSDSQVHWRSPQSVVCISKNGESDTCQVFNLSRKSLTALVKKNLVSAALDSSEKNLLVLEASNSHDKLSYSQRSLDEIDHCVAQWPLSLSRSSSEITCCAISSSCVALAFKNNDVFLWDVTNNKRKSDKLWNIGSESSIKSMFFIDDNVLVGIVENAQNGHDGICMYGHKGKLNAVKILTGKLRAFTSCMTKIAESTTDVNGVILAVFTPDSNTHLKFAYALGGEFKMDEIDSLTREVKDIQITPFPDLKPASSMKFSSLTEEEILVYSLCPYKKISSIKFTVKGACCFAAEENAEFIYFGSTDGSITVCNKDGLELNRAQVLNGAITTLLVNDQSDALMAFSESDLSILSTERLRMPSGEDQATQSGERASTLPYLRDAVQLLFVNDNEHLVTSSGNNLSFWSIKDFSIVSCLTLGCLKQMQLDNHGRVIIGVESPRRTLRIISVTEKQVVDGGDLPSAVVSFTVNREGNLLYALSKKDDRVTLHCLDLLSYSIKSSMMLQNTFPQDEDDIEIMLSDNEKYLAFKIRVTQKEYDIIQRAEQKQNLSQSVSPYKYAALDLGGQSPALITCFRILTKIPFLGNSWAVHSKSLILLGSNQKIIFWDVDNGTCDQKMLRGTKIPKFFRPIWIESEKNWGSLCHGKTLCMALDAQRKTLVAGSEDGYVMVYDMDTGKNRGGNVTRKKPHHAQKVSFCALSD